MSRTLRRPMFRRGGSANDGIMSGLEDREQLANGTLNPAAVGQSARDYIEQFEPLLREFTPKTRLPLGAVGAALVQGTPIKEALAGGYSQFVKADDAREAAIRKGAVSMGLGQALKDATPSKNILQNRKKAIVNIKARGLPLTEDNIIKDKDGNPKKNYWYNNRLKRAFTYKALNRLIQGSAADMTKRAMVDLHKEGITAHIQIHDELDFSIESESHADKIKQIMEQAVNLEVPNKVDYESGPNWGEIK